MNISQEQERVNVSKFDLRCLENPTCDGWKAHERGNRMIQVYRGKGLRLGQSRID